MKKYDLLIGVFAIIALLSIMFLALKASDLTAQVSEKESYKIQVPFTNIGGLRVRAPVSIGGVVIGRVAKIDLDKSFNAIVHLNIDNRYHNIPIDSQVSIRTKGLLGEQFVDVSAAFGGFEDGFWVDGSQVSPKYVRSAVALDELIGQAVFSGDKK